MGSRYKACETVARGKDTESGIPMLLYQLVVVDTDCYFIIQGLSGASRGGALAGFQQMAKKFRRVRPGERRTSPAQDQMPHEQTSQPAQPIPDQVADSRPRTNVKTPAEPQANEAVQTWEPHGVPDDRPKEANSAEEAAKRESDGSRNGREKRAAARSRRTRAPRLPQRAKKALPEFKYDADAAQTTPSIGSADRDRVKLVAPDGGVLVGLRVACGTDFGGSVKAIAPIFQVANRYKDLELPGEQGDDVHLLLAPAGFAVGGVQVGAGAWVDAVRLVYMRVDGNKLVTSEREYSEWIGGNGGSTSEIVSDGGLVIGMAFTAKENLQSIGLAYIGTKYVKFERPEREEKASQQPAAEFRTWTSANGDKKITAKLKTVQAGQAKLVLSDGREVSIPLEKLSKEDQEYLQKWRQPAATNAN